MPSIASLLESQINPSEVTITSEGYILWLSWTGDISVSVTQTLQDYGGLHVHNEGQQALWFFFTSDALLALAKLYVWVKFNPLAMTILAFPGILRVGVGQTLSLAMESDLAHQVVPPAEKNLEIWVHPRLSEIGANIPGLVYTPKQPHSGMANMHWSLISANTRLPYASSQGWYALLRPLGNPIDKRFQSSWRNIFEELDSILLRQKLKYSLNDNFLMVPIDDLRQLRVWVREVLHMFYKIKEADPESYWPCVSVIVDKRGLNFNNELPTKINIQWDTLMPDYPYMSYKNAYLLGEGFDIQDLNFTSGNTSIENWCNVNLTDLAQQEASIPMLMAGQLVSGTGQPCFYCGVRTHTTAQCPTRRMAPTSSTFWTDFSDIDLEAINVSFRAIESKLNKFGLAAYPQILDKGGLDSRILEGVLDNSYEVQSRIIRHVWLLTGRDINGEEDLSLIDDSPAWSLLERFSRIGQHELNIYERDVLAALAKTPRDAHLKSLLGFVFVERGDLVHAYQAWREAETLSISIIQQAWHGLLAGRVLEIQERFQEALEAYEAVQRLLPQWKASHYRRLICYVKMGFAGQVKNQFVDMVHKDPTLFNQILLDPELERGQKTILTTLYPLWIDAQKLCADNRNALVRMGKDIQTWFTPEHKLASRLLARVEDLITKTQVKNYLSFLNAAKETPLLDEEIQKLIKTEIDSLQSRYKNYLGTLEIVRDEASWFPFPRALVEFNKDFNACAGILNWAFTSDFRTPEAFKKAQESIASVEANLVSLNKHLRMLRAVRDSTLFMLIMLRTFIWIEAIALILCFLSLFGIVLFGDAIGLTWLQRLIRVNFWELQQVIIIIITVFALGIASLRSTLMFEKKRDSLLHEARVDRENYQRKRLEKAREEAQAAAAANAVLKKAEKMGVPIHIASMGEKE